ncbi:signal peptidase II [bacterium]|nr:signal peptidase II [bacterium]
MKTNLLNKESLKYILVFVLVLILDAISKAYFAKNMQLGESWPVIKGFFHFTLVHNPAAAFSIGHNWPRWVFHLSSFLALGVLFYMFYSMERKSAWVKWAATLIFAGAMGNIIDRIRLGYVIDFLDVFIGKHHWPAFNVADSAITIGAILFAIDTLFFNKASN